MGDNGKIIFRRIEGISKTLRIQINVSVRCISLVLIQESNEELMVYKSSMILEQNLKILADNLNMKVDVYFEKLISFFEDPQKVKYDFDENILTLTENVNTNLQRRYFQCNLEKISNSFIGHLIDDLFKHKAQSEIEMESLISENERIRKDVIEYKNKLNELVDRKIVDEKNMFCNFVSLLNEKKRKIQHLNELLEAFRGDSSLVDYGEAGNSENSRKKTKTTKFAANTTAMKEEISESDSDGTNQDTTTDEEGLIDATKPTQTNFDYNEILSESPTEVKFPKTTFPSSFNSNYIRPCTSKEIHLDQEFNEDNEPHHTTDDEKMVIVDTQELLDNL